MLDSRPNIHPILCAEGDETHANIAATRVLEYRIPDPRSTRADEFIDTRYLFICAADACEISASAHARWAGADWRTITTYPLTRADAEAILGSRVIWLDPAEVAAFLAAVA